MAQRVVTSLVDDLDGGEGDRTVTFSFEGVSYEIDLSEANIELLEIALQPFIDAARISGGSRRGRSRSRAQAKSNGSGDDVDPKTVREWAKSNGIEISPRGRIRADVVAQFRAAGN